MTPILREIYTISKDVWYLYVASVAIALSMSSLVPLTIVPTTIIVVRSLEFAVSTLRGRKEVPAPLLDAYADL